MREKVDGQAYIVLLLVRSFPGIVLKLVVCEYSGTAGSWLGSHVFLSMRIGTDSSA